MAHETFAGVAAFIALLGAALIISIVADRIHIPGAVLLVAVGTLAGTIWHLAPPFQFGPALLFIFLPPLVFEAGWHIDRLLLRAQAARIALLAVPGTIFSALSVAGALTVSHTLPFGPALLLGAMICATDPVAVIALFRTAAVPGSIKTLVEAESLANDGVAVVLYGIALASASGVATDWVAASFHGVVQLAGGIAIGAACALPVWIVLSGARTSEYEITATIALAYVAYLAADRSGCSGIFATATAAVVLRSLLHRVAFMNHRDDVDSFWNTCAYVTNATVFLATGLLINAPRALNEPYVVLYAVGALVASRVVLAALSGADRAGQVTVVLAGMRGALPLALALALPDGLPGRATIIDGVFAVVLVTLVLQGTTLEPIVKRIYGAAEATEM